MNCAMEWSPRTGLLLAAFSLSIGAFLFNQVFDYDVWWQVAIGRDILAKGAIPTIDSFAAAALGRPYHDSHWLFQVALALADRLGGMVGVQLLAVALWTAILACVAIPCRNRVPAVCWVPLLFLAAMASSERFIPRPELLTYLGLAFFCWRLREGRYRKPLDVAWLLLMQVVWANGHGLFVLGPFLAGCYWLAAAFGLRAAASRHDFLALSRLLALLLLATLLNPYGTGGWAYALLLFTEAGPAAPRLLKALDEMAPTFGAFTMSGVAFWFFLPLLLLAGGLTALAVLRKRPVPLPGLLILLTMLFLAASGRRNMVLFALVAAPYCADLLEGACFRRAGLAATGMALAMLLWSWFPLSGHYYFHMQWPTRTGLGATPSFFPHGLPAFLDGIGYRGQVFNSNKLGGFYLYHGHPQRLPFTDGRWEVYDLAEFERIGLATSTPLAWQAFAARYRIDGILLQHTSEESFRMLPFLSGAAGWRLVYFDAAASFWLPAGQFPAVPTLDAAAAPLPEVHRLDDGLILDAFYKGVGAAARRAENLRRALAFGQGPAELPVELGRVLIELGRDEEARSIFETRLAKAPRDIATLGELAYLAYRRGDLPGAESYLQRVLAIDPRNVDASANLQRLRAQPVDGGR